MAQCVCGTSSRETPSTSSKVRVVASRWRQKTATQVRVLTEQLPISPGQDGHQGALTCLASNKDGSLVLTGSVDGYARLINTATGKVGARETRQQTGNGVK